MMKKIFTVWIVVLTLAFAPAVAFAGESNPWVDQPTPGKQALHKFLFGLKNVVYGWTEIFQEPFEAYHDNAGDPWNERMMDVVAGFAGGTVYALTDTVGGALDIATFPATDLSIDLPEGGVSCPFTKY